MRRRFSIIVLVCLVVLLLSWPAEKATSGPYGCWICGAGGQCEHWHDGAMGRTNCDDVDTCILGGWTCFYL